MKSRHARFALVSALPLVLSLASARLASAEPARLRVQRGAIVPPEGPLALDASATEVEHAARAVVRRDLPNGERLSWGVPVIHRLGSGDRLVKLPQMHDGLPVANRGATVVFRGGVARVVAAKVETDFASETGPSVDEGVARAAAEARTGSAAVGTALVYWASPEGASLSWAVLSGSVELGHRWVSIVDARTGEVTLVYDTVRELDHASVFPSNPEKSPNLVDTVLPVGPNGLSNSLVESLNCIDKKTVTSVSVMGFNVDVHVCDLLSTAIPDANGDYTDMPAADTAPEDTYAEISMFYHANRAYSFFRTWDPTLDVNGGKPLATISNLRIPQGFDTFDLNKLKNPDLPLAPFQNAFFAPADPLFSTVFGLNGGAMWFGQGPARDYSYDGDVVYHEFTHAVVAATVNFTGNPQLDEYGTVDSPGAMNEGIADYFSCALTGDPDVGEYASQDFAPGSPAIRSLTATDQCPAAIGGEVHQDATLFSAGLWDVRSKLADQAAKDAFDKSVFDAMNVAPSGNLGYEEFAQFIIDEVKTSDSAAADALTAAFTARGVLPHCTRVLEFTGQPLKGPADLMNLWFAPGTQTTGVKAKEGWTPGVIQAHYTLPANSGKLTVAFTKVNVGGGGLGTTGTPFTPKVLVRFGVGPIQFTYGPLAAAETTLADAVAAGNAYTANVDVPAGATDASVMVVNAGQLDGAYTALSLTAEPAMNTGTGGAGGATSSSSTGAGGGNNVNPTDDGCGCEIPGQTSGGSHWVAAIALGAIAIGRRRRAR
ncbi:MAG: M36 family metallopeptidase [Polyangiaceae bacterium]